MPLGGKMNKRELRQLLCAMLLGDGCIVRETKTAAPQFTMHHSIKQKEYALWKAEQIDKIFKKKRLTRRCCVNEGKTKDSKGKYHGTINIRLSWAKYMRLLRSKVYKSYKGTTIKNVEFLLKQCSGPKHLAIWFMDDGSEYRQKKKHVDGTRYIGNPILYLHTCSFTDGQVNLIIEWFKQHYGITPRITRTSKKQGSRPRLRFRTNDSRKIFNIIRPYLTQFDTMKHKFRSCFERY